MSEQERVWNYLAVYIERSKDMHEGGEIRVQFTDCTTAEEVLAQLKAKARSGYKTRELLGFVYRPGTAATNALHALLTLNPLGLTVGEKGGGPYPDHSYSVLHELEELMTRIFLAGFSCATEEN